MSLPGQFPQHFRPFCPLSQFGSVPLLEGQQYVAKFVLYNICNEVNRSIDAEIRFESRVKTRLNNVNDFTETRIQRDYERHQEQCLRYWESINEDKEQYWGVLKELYGDFPKDLFQRLMAVEYQQTF